MSENYSLIINSQNATNRLTTSTPLNSNQYYINWSSVLPKRYQMYNVSFTLKSVNITTSLTVNALVGINFGQTNLYDQSNNPSTTLGICYPVAVQQTSTTWNYFYNSTLNDNTPVTISYPSNSIITVNFTNFDLTTPVVMQHYILQLQFTPLLVLDQGLINQI